MRRSEARGWAIFLLCALAARKRAAKRRERRGAGGESRPEPTFNDKIRTIQRHLQLLEEHDEPNVIIKTMCKRISWYGKSLGHVKPLKEVIRTATNLHTIRDALEAWLLPDGDAFTEVDHDRYCRLIEEEPASSLRRLALVAN